MKKILHHKNNNHQQQLLTRHSFQCYATTAKKIFKLANRLKNRSIINKNSTNSILTTRNLSEETIQSNQLLQQPQQSFSSSSFSPPSSTSNCDKTHTPEATVTASVKSVPAAAATVSRVYNKTVTKTGSFAHNWPTVHEAPIHYKRAYRQTQQVVMFDRTIKNERNQYRKYAAQFIDTLMKQLTVPISTCLDLYSKNFKDLHPYEATVANLTVVAKAKIGFPELSDVLKRLKQLRAKTSLIAKDYAKQCGNASNVVACKELLENATIALQELYEEQNEYTQALTDLMEIHKDLRRIPIIQLTLPTIVLVGSPNVGKSSIVRAISSGTPEVNDYPFTTRGVTIGHILYDHPETNDQHKFQVMDTPGLLDRPEEERNEMERLTFASLLHLPTAVIYVIDHTNQAGEKSTLPAQLNIRKLLKQRFPKRPWIDVISKGDLLPFSSEAKELFREYGLSPSEEMEEVAKNHLTTPFIVSVKTEKNIPVLKDTVIQILLQLKQILLKTHGSDLGNESSSSSKSSR